MNLSDAENCFSLAMLIPKDAGIIMPNMKREDKIVGVIVPVSPLNKSEVFGEASWPTALFN